MHKYLHSCTLVTIVMMTSLRKKLSFCQMKMDRRIEWKKSINRTIKWRVFVAWTQNSQWNHVLSETLEENILIPVGIKVSRRSREIISKVLVSNWRDRERGRKKKNEWILILTYKLQSWWKWRRARKRIPVITYLNWSTGWWCVTKSRYFFTPNCGPTKNEAGK